MFRIPLNGGVRVSASIELQAIEWWRPESRFVVLRYACHGESVEAGVRVDLDKRILLDRFNDRDADAKADQLVQMTISFVAQARRAGCEQKSFGHQRSVGVERGIICDTADVYCT